MALANVAWALATNSERVLVIDWDLEAPGLHRYFHPFLSDPDQKSSQGLIDRVWEYLDSLESAATTRSDRFKLADCADIVQPLDIPGSSRGCLHFIGAGQQDAAYSEKVVGLDWNGFYLKFDGRAFIDHFIEWARSRYTHILIDSRTGVADTAGICTTQLPDALVMCLVYNRQSIEGTASVAQSIQQERSKIGRGDLRIEFVPSRVEDRSTVESARRYTTSKLGQVSGFDRSRLQRSLRKAEIRHYPWCAFEEKLAVFEEFPDSKGSLLEAMHDLTRRIAKVDRRRFLVRSFEPGILDSYWARAAFDDPRLFELETLLQDQRESGWKSIYLWLREALIADDPRADWKMSLAEATVEFLAKGAMNVSEDDQSNAIRLVQEVARSAWLSDREVYGTRFAIVLQSVAVHHQQAKRLREAAMTIGHAVDLLEDDRTQTTRWRLGRALERQADIEAALGDHSRAIETLSRALDIYSSLDRGSQHFGAQFDLPRVQRLLAAECMRVGRLLEANRLMRDACVSLTKVSRNSIGRDDAEALRILKARLRIAAEVDAPEFTRARNWVSEAGRDLLSPTALGELELELALLSASRLFRNAQPDEALIALSEVPDELVRNPEVVALRAQILIASGHRDVAIDMLWFAVRELRTNLTPELIDVARQAFEGSSRPGEFIEFLFSARDVGVLAKDTMIAKLVANLAAHDATMSKLDQSKLFNLLDYVIRQRED